MTWPPSCAPSPPTGRRSTCCSPRRRRSGSRWRRCSTRSVANLGCAASDLGPVFAPLGTDAHLDDLRAPAGRRRGGPDALDSALVEPGDHGADGPYLGGSFVPDLALDGAPPAYDPHPQLPTPPGLVGASAASSTSPSAGDASVASGDGVPTPRPGRFARRGRTARRWPCPSCRRRARRPATTTRSRWRSCWRCSRVAAVIVLFTTLRPWRLVRRRDSESVTGRRPLLLLLVAVVLVGVAGAVVLGSARDASDLRDERDDREEVQPAGRRLRRGVPELRLPGRRCVRRPGAGAGDRGVRRRLRGRPGRRGSRRSSPHIETTTVARTTDVYVGDIGEETAQAYVIVDVDAANDTAGQQTLRGLSFLVSMAREDGEWRVDSVSPPPTPDVDGATAGAERRRRQRQSPQADVEPRAGAAAARPGGSGRCGPAARRGGRTGAGRGRRAPGRTAARMSGSRVPIDRTRSGRDEPAPGSGGGGRTTGRRGWRLRSTASASGRRRR